MMSIFRNLFYFVLPNLKQRTATSVISSLYDCMVNIKLKYNFVETPRKFTITELSIRKLGFSSVLMMHYY